MTKIAENPIVQYVGDGATVIFDTTFEVFDLADIKVQVIDADGVEQAIAVDGAEPLDYIVTGQFNNDTDRYSESEVSFNEPLPAGYRLGLTREAAITQELDLSPGGSLPAQSLEHRLDRIIAISQDLREQMRRALLQSSADSTQYDLGGKRLTGLADPIYDTDAASRAWVNAQLELGGIKGEKGDTGSSGESAVAYQIRATNGTAIKNSTGSLTIEAIKITGDAVEVLASGAIQLYDSGTLVTVANGYATGSDGYTGVLDAGDINDSVVIELRDGPTGEVYDTISLIDVADGTTSNATTASVEAANGLFWKKDSAGVWSPAATTLDLVATFYQSGAAISTGTARATLDQSTGLVTFSELSSDATVNLTFINNGTANPSVEFEETAANFTVTEGVLALQDGVNGTNGTAGQNATAHQLVPINGTVIKNGTGTLTVEARVIDGSSSTLLSSGTIKIYDPSNNEVNVANGYATGSDGYTAVLDADDIDDSIVLTLKDGTGGAVLDTIALADVLDGTASNATTGWVEASPALGWRQAVNKGPWSPAQTYIDVTAYFAQGGATIATETRRVNLDQGAGTLTSALFGNNDANITVAVSGSGTGALTVTFTHTPSGHVVAETITTVQGGEDGAPGDEGAAGQDAIEVGFTASNGLTSVQNAQGAWSPANNVSDIVFSFTRKGSVIATRTIRATRNNSTGLVTLAVVSGSATGLTTSSSFTNNGTLTPSVTCSIADGPSTTVSFASTLSGSDGNSVVNVNRDSGIDGSQNANGSSSVVHPASGTANVEIEVVAGGVGFWVGSPPTGGTLRLFEDGTEIGKLDVNLTNSSEPVGEGGGNIQIWTSNPPTWLIAVTRQPAAGNRVYTTTWSASTTNQWYAATSAVKIKTKETYNA